MNLSIHTALLAQSITKVLLLLDVPIPTVDIGCDFVSKSVIVPFQVVINFETEQANPFVTPGFPGHHHYYELVRRQHLSLSLYCLLPLLQFDRTMLTSLVSYKSPDNVPDTFTPDVMQPVIRLSTALLSFGQLITGTNVTTRFRHH